MMTIRNFLASRWSAVGCRSLLSKCDNYRHCHQLPAGSSSLSARVPDLVPTEDQTAAFHSAYTDVQQKKILTVLNGSTVNQLTVVYEITKKNAQHIIKHRNNLGFFGSLQDLLEIGNVISLGPLFSLCDSIVYGLSTEGQSFQRIKWKLCYPNLSEGLIETLNSIVVLQLYSKDATWLHFSRDFRVLKWEHMHLTDFHKIQGNRMSLHYAHIIVDKLPVADLYLMDDRKFELRTMKTVPIILRILRLECMVTALLERRFAETGCSNRIHLIKNSVVANYFQLKIGNEQVSGQHLVQGIVNGTDSPDVRKPTMDKNTWSWYNEQIPEVKEYLTNSLLKAIAFYQLEVSKVPVEAI